MIEIHGLEKLADRLGKDVLDLTAVEFIAEAKRAGAAIAEAEIIQDEAMRRLKIMLATEGATT